jgi:hypothetical protein
MSEIIVIDGSTGEVIAREATQEELANQEVIASEQAALQAEQDAKELAKASALAKLAALGLTEEEIAAL